MSALLRLTATETRLFLREPMSWAFTLGLPPLLMVILGSVPSFRLPEEGLGGLRVIDLYAPIIVALAITMLALTTLPQHFTTYRDKGVLRRLRVTPIKPRVMLSAQLLMSLAMAVITMVAILTIGRLAFAVALPQNVFAYLFSFILTTAALVAIGLLVAALAPTGTAAGGIGTLLVFPLLFFGGLWIPRASMNDTLVAISDATPLGAGVQALQDATAGNWPQLLHVAVVLAWLVVAGGLAARFFRWE